MCFCFCVAADKKSKGLKVEGRRRSMSCSQIPPIGILCLLITPIKSGRFKLLNPRNSNRSLQGRSSSDWGEIGEARPIARKICRKRPSLRSLSSRQDEGTDEHPCQKSNDEIKFCGPELLNPIRRMRHTSKTFLPSVSEKIFGNGSKPPQVLRFSSPLRSRPPRTR